jgi:hypothetical protein
MPIQRPMALSSFTNADVWTDTHLYCLEVRRAARVVSAFLEIGEGLSRTDVVPGLKTKARQARKS